MDIEFFTNYLLILVFCLFSIVRIEYYRRAKRAGYRTVVSESKKYAIWLSVFICYEVFTFFTFVEVRTLRWNPHLLSWADMALPDWVRLLGAALALAALGLFVWIHRTLGTNLSATLRIKDNHTLVTVGPYAFIRHPMYSSFYLLHVAVFFLTANWFIGLTWIIGLSLIVLLRVDREEAMLVERFGEEYRTYMRRTGRFLPLIRSARGAATRDTTER
jgi:protein-S-isoprenylcysteine O-methyltransferase Ste14